MVRFFRKMTTCICIILVLFNFILHVATFATEPKSPENVTDDFNESVSSEDSLGDKFASVLSGIAGILTWFPRVMIIGAASIIQTVGASAAKIAGETDAGAAAKDITLSPDDVIFNKINLTSIDFFDIEKLPEGNAVREIREQIALWYYVMRMIAFAILLVILIIVGIRMAITTIASEKAIYKKALFDWATSMALIFLMHYIIRGVLWMNSSLVTIFSNMASDMNLDNILKAIRELAFHVDFTAGWGAVAVYIMLTIQSLMFLISYVKRMLVLAFLIIISPLITITYSIDKMGDQKAQALNNWLKEFIFNVLIQPFHCILYLAFVSIAIAALESYASIGAMLLALLCIKFVWDGEKIVRKIFGFEQASSLAAAAASGAVLGSMINKATSAGKTASSGIKYAKNSKTGQALKQKWDERKSENKELKGLSHKAKKEYREQKKSGASEDVLSEIKNNENNKSRFKKASESISNNKSIKEMKEKTNALREKAREKVSNSRGAQKVINGAKSLGSKAKDFANSDLGKAIGTDAKKFVRKVTRPESLAKIGAGIIAGSAMLALPDSNMFTAAMGGYAAGKHAENKVREMRNRKSENYEEQLSKAWENHCNVTGTDKNNKDAFSNWVETVNGEGKLDRYSQKNLDKKEDDTSKKLKESLGLDDNTISRIIAEIKKAIISEKGYNPEEIGKKYKVDPTTLNSLVGSFAAMYNNSIIFEKTDAFDTQMEPYGYSHEDVVEEMNFSSSTNVETTTNEDLDALLEKYGYSDDDESIEDKLSDIDRQIEQKIKDAQRDLELAMGNAGYAPTNIELESFETTVKGALDRGVDDIESVVRSELSRLQPDATPTTEVVREIKERITFKHEIERDRQIIQRHNS